MYGDNQPMPSVHEAIGREAVKALVAKDMLVTAILQVHSGVRVGVGN